MGQTYAFVLATTIFVCLLIAAGSRSAPGVLLTLWRKAFGWDRAVIFLAAAASAAFMAGALHSAEGRYLEAFVIAGGAALAAAGMSLLVGRLGPRPALVRG